MRNVSTRRKKEDIKQHWENECTVSLKDQNLRQLEVQAISDLVSAIGGTNLKVCDLGCGDGVNTMVLCGHKNVKHVTGIDYSSMMIRRAKKRAEHANLRNLTLLHGEYHRLQEFPGTFDVVVTQRCLINLPTPSEQEKATQFIAKSLKQGGYYIMLEAFRDGLNGINTLRKSLSLDPLAMPWHNNYFNKNRFLKVLKKYFHVLCVKDFSVYYLYTRILNPLLGFDVDDPVSKKVDEIAARVQSKFSMCSLSIGPQVALLLRKKR